MNRQLASYLYLLIRVALLPVSVSTTIILALTSHAVFTALEAMDSAGETLPLLLSTCNAMHHTEHSVNEM